MTLPDPSRHLMDVNTLIALLDENHEHHRIVLRWFTAPDRKWSLCLLTEMGLLRYLTRTQTGELTMLEATEMLSRLKMSAGYSYQPDTNDWATVTERFASRIFGHRQVTDAYLLGLALSEDLILVTFDKALIHLAGEYSKHVLLLTA